jgi:hypothetical protein
MYISDRIVRKSLQERQRCRISSDSLDLFSHLPILESVMSDLPASHHVSPLPVTLKQGTFTKISWIAMPIVRSTIGNESLL